MRVVVRVFFVKQKTGYEMLRGLVGAEMCIRDSCNRGQELVFCNRVGRDKGFATESVHIHVLVRVQVRVQDLPIEQERQRVDPTIR